MVTRARLALALPLSIAVLAVSAAACTGGETKKKTVDRFLPTESTALDLELEFPAGGGFASTCAGASSYLVRIDTAGNGVWSYTLLFDEERTTLYGCGDAGTPCPAGTGLATEIPSVARLMIEGIGVAPPLYEADAHDVICRGIADDAVDGAAIELVEDPAQPTPQETPGYAVTRTLTATVKMLRIGAGNPLPFGGAGVVPAQRRFGAAASLSSPALGFGLDARGRVVLAGGVTPAEALPVEIWELDTQTLSFSVSSSTLPGGRAGLSATAFPAVSADDVAVLFAGGASSTEPQTDEALLWRPIGSVGLTMEVARSFHAAAYLDRGAAADPVIALVGGVGYDIAGDVLGPAATDTYEYYIPESSTLGDPCSTTPVADGEFCQPVPTNELVAARGYFATVLFQEGGAPKIWIGGGAAGATASGQSETFQGGGDGGFIADEVFNPTVGGAGMVLTSSGQPLVEGRAVIAGGFVGTDLSQPQATDVAYRRAENGGGTGVSQFSARLKFERGGLQATPLRDWSVLLTGGRDDDTGLTAGILPVEVFVSNPSTMATADSGEFRFMPSPGGNCNTIGTSPTGCAALSTPRWGHTATRLDATRTWLDGAVLIAGGAEAGAEAEIFVPAYQCDGQTPVNPATGIEAQPLSEPTLPELCDLGRDPVAVTDPRL